MTSVATKDRVGRLIRRPTPVPRDRMVRHDPRATRTLAEPMWLEDTRRSTRYELVAGSATGGMLRPVLAGQALPSVGQRLTLLGGHATPVRFVVQVDDWMLRGGATVVSVRWVLLSGPQQGGELEGILRSVLGVSVEADDSGPRPKGRGRLVYQAERKTLRTLGTAAPRV